MSHETITSLLNFAKTRLKKNGLIWFFGGEPMCNYEGMQYTVRKAQAENLAIRFGLTTNLTQIDEEKAKWMGDHNFGILCSLDLSKERHNKYRIYPDGSGTWDDAWKGLQFVRKHINKTPQIRATFGPDTVKGIADDMDSLIKQGLTTLAVDAVYEAEWNEESLQLLADEFAKLRVYFEDWFNEGLNVHSMFVRDGIAPAINRTRSWYSHCGLGQGGLGVDVNGDLYPCHRFVSSRAIKIGNVKTGFEPERIDWIEKWQKTPPYSSKPTKCLTCSFKTACNGGCIAANYDTSGSPHIIPEAFCNIKQLCVEYFGDFTEKYNNNKAFTETFLKRRKQPEHTS